MIWPVLGVLAGVIIGFKCPYTFPSWASSYVAVAILAFADTVLGGIVAILEGKFDKGVFVSGFIINAALAAFIVWLGEQLNIELLIDKSLLKFVLEIGDSTETFYHCHSIFLLGIVG